MFWHLFRYQCKITFRVKELIFWTLIFPFALSTFMYLAFSNIFETTEKMKDIPIAIVKEGENAAADSMFEALSDGEDALLVAKEMTQKEAEEKLEEEEVKGIFYVSTSLRLQVKENGMEQTILQMILKQYQQNSTLLLDVSIHHPEKIHDVIQVIQQEKNYIIKEKMGGSNPDNIISYFYAIFAMTCMFASFSGCSMIHNVQSYTSELGRRKSVAPVSKLKEILSEFAASELIQFFLACLVLFYTTFVLKLNLGGNYGKIVLLLFVGTSMGNMIGICIGSLRLTFEAKIGSLVGIGLGLCFLADLMVSGIRAFIQEHAPIVNAINPASRIVDSFYALNMDLMGRYWRNIGGMLVLTVIFLVISVCLGKGGKKR